MNVTELARQLNTTKEELLENLPSLGFDIGLRAIKVDNAVAVKIKKAWSMHAKTSRLKEKMAKQEISLVKKEHENLQNKEIFIGDKITVNDLASKLGTNVTRLIGYLMKNGIMATLNEQVDFETASIISEDYGFKATKKEGEAESHESEDALRELKKNIAQSDKGISRAPVVVVMGHVDHGKTTLLDTIRKTNVVAGESGGITQHIGAYQVLQNGRNITCLDTPGHEAFKAMRERGGQVADVAILVVAADDGLKPQTLESINVIQKESLPFVVAINKIDKPGADIDKVKKELSEINLVPEDWGGKTITSSISAKKGEGIAELLDMVLLVADMEKFTADPNGSACGVIIESHVDKGEGPVATVLIKSGTLRIGEEVAIGDVYGKIKALKDWQGNDVALAPPSMPVKILGLKATPNVGDILYEQKTDRTQRKKSSKRYKFIDVNTEQKQISSDVETESDEKKEKTFFRVVVKADVLGSLEALIASIKKLEKKEVSIGILKQG
jgi:translation initiation factor IF-2